MGANLNAALIEYAKEFGGGSWQFQDAEGSSTAADASGNGYTLTCTDVTFGEAGLIPANSYTSALFSTSSKATKSFAPSWTSGVSFIVFFKVPTLQSAGVALVNTASSTAGGDFRIGSSNEPAFVCANGTTQVTCATSTAITAGHVYMGVATWDCSATLTLYIIDITSDTAWTPVTAALSAGTFTSGSGSVTIGSDEFAGYLENVAIVGTCLSQAQVTVLANLAKADRNLLDPGEGYAQFSAYAGADNVSPSAYETDVCGRNLSIVSRYYNLGTSMPSSADTTLMEGGQFLDFGISTVDGSTTYTWQQVAEGDADSLLETIASNLAAIPYPVMVTPTAEFDGTSRQDSCGSPTYFVAFWQHMWEIIAPVAPNVIWNWDCTGGNYPDAQGGVTLASMYPGDWCVDWILTDPYDESLSKGGDSEPAGGPAATFGPFFEWLADQTWGQTKLYGLRETGVDDTEPDASIATWLENVPTAMQTYDLRRFTWFNDTGTLGNTAIDPSTQPDSVAAMKSIGASSFFNPPSGGPSVIYGSGAAGISISASGTESTVLSGRGAAGISLTASGNSSVTVPGAPTSAWQPAGTLLSTKPAPGLSLRVVCKATVLSYGNPVFNIENIEPGGTVTLDTTAEQLRQCQFQCVDTSGTLAPPAGSLQPNGLEIALSLGYVYNDVLVGPWSVGIFGISELDNATGTGTNNPVGPILNVEGLDRSAQVAASLFTDSYTIPAGTTLQAGVLGILNQVMPAWWIKLVNPKIAETPYTMAQQIFQQGDDPWEGIQNIAEAFGCVAYFDANGRLIVRQCPALSNSNPVFGIQDGAGQVATDATATVSNQPGYNGVLVTGTSPNGNTTYNGVAWDDDPTSPTYYLGPYGKRPAPSVEVTTIQNQAQANAMARAMLSQVLGLTRQASINMLPIPWIDAFDLIYVKVGKVQLNGCYILEQATIPLDYSQLESIVAVPVGTPISVITGLSPSPDLNGTPVLDPVLGQDNGDNNPGAVPNQTPNASDWSGAVVLQGNLAGQVSRTSLTGGEQNELGSGEVNGPDSTTPLSQLTGIELIWSGGGQWSYVDLAASQRWQYAASTQGSGSH